MILRFGCGHVGKMTENSAEDVFIRVAEIRGKVVWSYSRPCPDCR